MGRTCAHIPGPLRARLSSRSAALRAARCDATAASLSPRSLDPIALQSPPTATTERTGCRHQRHISHNTITPTAGSLRGRSVQRRVTLTRLHTHTHLSTARTGNIAWGSTPSHWRPPRTATPHASGGRAYHPSHASQSPTRPHTCYGPPRAASDGRLAAPEGNRACRTAASPATGEGQPRGRSGCDYARP